MALLEKTSWKKRRKWKKKRSVCSQSIFLFPLDAAETDQDPSRRHGRARTLAILSLAHPGNLLLLQLCRLGHGLSRSTSHTALGDRVGPLHSAGWRPDTSPSSVRGGQFTPFQPHSQRGWQPHSLGG